MEPLQEMHRFGGADYWPWLWEQITVNDIVVIKIHWGEMDYPWVHYDIKWLFPPGSKYIWLFQHRNIIAQAASWERARRTGIWFKRQSPILRPRPSRWQVEEVIRHNRAWGRWFQSNNVQPYFIRFENLIKDPTRIVDQIFTLVQRAKEE